MTLRNQSRILLLGSTSFAATGLIAKLQNDGHLVTRYGRTPSSEDGYLHGDLLLLADDDRLVNFDVIINFALLKDQDTAANAAYARSLAALCLKAEIKHLIHISSVSVYSTKASRITESSPLANPQSGGYGAAKIVTDNELMRTVPRATRITFLRPGFILGEGLVNPLVGTAATLPSGNLLILGNPQSQFPITTRDSVHEAILAVLKSPPEVPIETLLLVDSRSPTRAEFVSECAGLLGLGRIRKVPGLLWTLAGSVGGIAHILTSVAAFGPIARLKARGQRLRFDNGLTAKRLSVQPAIDWRSELRASMQLSPTLTVEPRAVELPGPRSVSYIGFGRVAKQKHLPALRALKVETIHAYDAIPGLRGTVRAEPYTTGMKIAASDLLVVATPGPIHSHALDSVRSFDGPVLVEKPLCYTAKELEEWLSVASSRKSAISVCHNYRFKNNVLALLAFLRQRDPGAIRAAHVDFQSPPVAQDSSPWLRKERDSRTLLMDYGLHFLDLACMWSTADWTLDAAKVIINRRQETHVVTGAASCATYSVSFVVRQGLGPRHARVKFSFDNFDAHLSFFPDFHHFELASENPWLYTAAAGAAAKSFASKVGDKLRSRDSDKSHSHAIVEAMQARPAISISNLASFYRLLHTLADRAYST